MRRSFMLALAAGCTALAFAADGAPPAYAPGLGDFMTAYVQPHHIKLWYAGEAADWRLAAYEADELSETFEDVVTYHSDWENVPVAQLVKTIIEPSLDKVKAAIDAKSVARFGAAYMTLTSACNACHTAAKKDFIEIKVPTRDPYTDQNFAPR